MGLNFQTCTIINKNVDIDSNVKGATLFEGKDNTLRIKRDFVFEKANVLAIRKAEGHKATACKAVIDFEKVLADLTFEAGEKNKYCRLDIYLGVEGAEPFIYSTPWVQKGLPFWVEFTVKKPAGGSMTKEEAAAVAKDVADAIKKNHLFVIDKDLMTVSVEGAVMTLTGNTEYQRFKNITVHTFKSTDDYTEVLAELVKMKGDTAASDKAIYESVRGTNSFGTYTHIVKDLRLPTAANYQWTRIRQAETPVVGAIYNQYIIEYCAPASNHGFQAVGERLNSHTTHVFWVNNDIKSDWEAALAVIDPDGNGTIDAENKSSELEA